MDNRDDYYCCISSHRSVCNLPMGLNMSDTSFNTIIMDNSHDPKMMMVRHQMFILMLTVQFMYKMCYGVQVIFYIFLLNI